MNKPATQAPEAGTNVDSTAIASANYLRQDFSTAVIARNPVAAQLLGLCPLMAVSSSVANALGLALASAFVLIGANTLIAALRRMIPEFLRLPSFVLIIATFTTVAVMLLEAYAYGLFERIALFVQIIVTNCMILGRAESFASRQPVPRALADAAGTALGFAIVLLTLGAIREIFGHGTLLADMQLLGGEHAQDWRIDIVSPPYQLLLLSLPPGAFIAAGLLLAAVQALRQRRTDTSSTPTRNPESL